MPSRYGYANWGGVGRGGKHRHDWDAVSGSALTLRTSSLSKHLLAALRRCGINNLTGQACDLVG